MLSKYSVEKAFSEPIIGTVAFSENEIEYTKHKTRKCVEKYCISSKDVSPDNDRLVFLGCVNALKEWEKADTKSLFAYLAKTFDTVEVTKLRKYVCSVIDRLSNTDLFVVKEGKNYYATLLFHSLAPKESAYSFFELCWNIFCNELGEVYVPENLIYQKMAAKLKELFSETTEKSETEICQMKLGSNVYSLFLGMKVMAREKPELLARLIDRVICLIDKLFYGQKLDHNIDYLSKLVASWWKCEKQNTLGEEVRTGHARQAIVSDERNIIPHFRYNDDNEVVLEIPAFAIDVDRKCDVIIRIHNDEDSSYYDLKMHVRTSGLLCSVKAFEVPLDKYHFPMLRVEIWADNRCVHNSKHSLYRDFIVFSDKGREIRHQIIQPGRYFMYCLASGELKQNPDLEKCAKYLYEFEAKEGDVLRSGSYAVFFSDGKNKAELWMDSSICKNISFILNGIPYSVVDGEINIVLNRFENINDYGISINSTNFRLGEFNFTEREQWYSFNLTDCCMPGEPVYIRVFRFSSNKTVFELYLIRFEDVNLEFNQKYYYGSYSGNVKFRTARFDECRNFCSVDDQVLIPFGKGEIAIDIPSVSWKMTGFGLMTSEISHPLWYENISPAAVMEFSVPAGMDKTLVLSDQGNVQINKKGEYLIGAYLHELRANGQKESVTAFLKLSEGNMLPLFECCLKEKFISPPVIIAGSDCRISWYNKEYFVGPKDSRFRVDLETPTGIRKDIFPNPVNFQSYYFPEVEGKCSCKVIYLKEYGFEIEDQVVLCLDFFAGDEKSVRFRNKSFKLDRVILKNSSEIRSITWINVDRISFDQELNGYTCTLYFMNKGKRIDFYRHYDTQTKLTPVGFELLEDGRIKLVHGCDTGKGKPFYLENNGHLSPVGDMEIEYFLPDTFVIQEKKVINMNAESEKTHSSIEQKKDRAPKTINVSWEKIKKSGYRV